MDAIIKQEVIEKDSREVILTWKEKPKEFFKIWFVIRIYFSPSCLLFCFELVIIFWSNLSLEHKYYILMAS